ncbi:MAG TPA: hypothetical protein VFI63_01005 [Solirubrobacterales bacterium]|nr:hypothetical protein [Solirubrobacterales bacterium]
MSFDSMLGRRQINSWAGPRLRSSVATAAGPVREVAWVVEERLVWGIADALRAALDAARWPLEKLAWTLEQRLVWPLVERLGNRAEPKRAAGAAALALAVAGTVALAIVSGSGHGGTAAVQSGARTAASIPAPNPGKAAAPHAAPAPVLHGVAPDLTPRAGISRAAASGKPKAAASAAATSPQGSSATATATLPAAAPSAAAIEVAHRFSNAFVRYETGKDTPAVRAAFAETATPKLVHSLLRRPPRLPANVEIPQARVMNVVPGPRLGKVYTVSVSLLRVGLTSELRLSMQHEGGAAPPAGHEGGGPTSPAGERFPGHGGGWKVTDILG